uniref:Uncharacterized protein n=1 Tax=Arundo donax TaxID=35708 RepID=A0A0A9CW09_ARUDO
MGGGMAPARGFQPPSLSRCGASSGASTLRSSSWDGLAHRLVGEGRRDSRPQQLRNSRRSTRMKTAMRASAYMQVPLAMPASFVSRGSDPGGVSLDAIIKWLQDEMRAGATSQDLPGQHDPCLVLPPLSRPLRPRRHARKNILVHGVTARRCGRADPPRQAQATTRPGRLR